MARAKNVSYRVGGISHDMPYLAVKRDGRYAFIGTAPKLNDKMIAVGVQDIEDGKTEFERLWGWHDNELPFKIFEVLHNENEGTLAEMNIKRADLGVLAAFALYPDSYEAERSKEQIAIIMRNAQDSELVTSALDSRYWELDVAIADGELVIDLPPVKEDHHYLRALVDIIKYGVRHKKRGMGLG